MQLVHDLFEDRGRSRLAVIEDKEYLDFPTADGKLALGGWDTRADLFYWYGSVNRPPLTYSLICCSVTIFIFFLSWKLISKHNRGSGTRYARPAWLQGVSSHVLGSEEASATVERTRNKEEAMKKRHYRN